MFQNVADEEISAADSASFIIAQMTAFGIEAENAQHIIDAVNETSNQFSVSSADLANSLGNMSAAMAAGNVAFEEGLGLLVSGTEVTRNSNKVSRALVSVQSRLNQILDEGSSTGKALTAWYKEHNIAIYDQEGQLRSLYDILTDVAEIWPTLTRNEQAYYLNQQAGANQTQNLAAILGNFDHAIAATNTALNSAGSATRENEKYMQGLEATLQQVKGSLQELAYNLIDSGLVKGLLDLANAFLQLANTPIGRFVTQITLLTGVLWGGSSLIKAMKIVPTLLSQWGNAFSLLTGKTTAAQLAQKALQTEITASGTAFALSGKAATAYGTIISTLNPIMTAISVGIVAISAGAKIWDALTTSVEELREEMEALEGEISSLESERDDLVNRGDLTKAEETRLRIIEQQLEAKKEIMRIDAQETYEKEYGTKDKGIFSNAADAIADNTKDLSNYIDTINKAKENLSYIEDQILSLDKTSADYNTQMEYLTEQYDLWNESLANARSSGAEIASDLVDLKEKGAQLSEVDEQLVQDFLDIAESTEGATSGTDNLANALEDAQTVAQNARENFAALVDELSGLDDIYTTLTEAVDEYNTYGNLTADTVAKLLELDDEYLSMLDLQNGKLVLNKEKFDQKVSSLKDTAIAESNSAYMADVNRIAIQNQNTAMQNAIGVVQGLASNLQSLESRMATTAAAAGNLAISLALALGGQGTSGLNADLSAAEEAARNRAALINSLVVSRPSGSSGGGRGSSSSGGGSTSAAEKEQTDPLEERKKLYQEQVDILEHQLFLLEKQEGTEQKRIALNRQIQEYLHKQAEWYRAQGESDDSEYIRDLQSAWWELEDNITSIEESITEKNSKAFQDRLQISKDYVEDRNFYNDWGADSEIAAWKRVLEWMKTDYYEKGLITYEEYAEEYKEISKKLYEAEQKAAEEAQKRQEELLQNRIDAINNQLDKYNDKISDYETAFNYVAEKAQEEIDKLNEQYDDTEKFWDDKIQAVQDANEELDRQIELEEALDNLAKARSKRVLVYKDGRYQYVEDIDAVSSAQANLERLEREEKLRQEIENLEQMKENALDLIQDQIAYWEKYRDEWGSVVDDYQKEQDRLIAEQILGVKLEGDNWEKRLGNLSDYIQKYKDLLEEARKAQEELDYLDKVSDKNEANGALGGATSDYEQSVINSVKQQMEINAAKWHAATSQAEKDRLHKANQELGASIGATYDPDTGIWDFSNAHISGGSGSSGGSSSGNKGSSGGSSSSSGVVGDYFDKVEDSLSDAADKFGDILGGLFGKKHAKGTPNAPGGISLVGEQGPELRVLNSGDGILPSDITRNLWNWGMLSPFDLISHFDGLKMTNLDRNMSIVIQQLNLPEVRDGNDFINYFQGNIWRTVVQQFSKNS